VGVLGVGSYAPERVLTNTDLERLVDTSHQWIIERTGMVERRIAAPGQAASDLAAAAAQRALADAGLAPADVELIIVATATPDHLCPATACYVQQKLGATRAAGFDVSAACSGFMSALTTAHGLLSAGSFANALVIGTEVLSSITNYEDRDSCILFGDGAGAFVLGTDPSQGELLDNIIGMDGSGADLIIIPAGGSRRPVSVETVTARQQYLSIQGRKVFRFAVEKLCELTHALLERNGFSLDDIGLLVPHQANLRIIEAGAAKLGIDLDRVFVNITRYGNTSSASVPLAFDEARASGRLQKGMLVCMLAFGGGLTWGGSLMRW
jgi:3-oxoacyl-[acyl-carrier-protein] synthase-3